jgi:hypothetical protein
MKVTIDTPAKQVLELVETAQLDTRDKKLARQILTKQIEFLNSQLPETDNEIDRLTILERRDQFVKARREI